MADDTERWRRQPGLHLAAAAACSYQKTDGSCMPRNDATCRCWTDADHVIEATGLSCQAVAWIFQHREQIEREAEQARGQVGKP